MNEIIASLKQLVTNCKGLFIVALLCVCAVATSQNAPKGDSIIDIDKREMTIPADVEDESEGEVVTEEEHAKPAWWSTGPFLLLLLI